MTTRVSLAQGLACLLTLPACASDHGRETVPLLQPTHEIQLAAPDPAAAGLPLAWVPYLGFDTIHQSAGPDSEGWTDELLDEFTRLRYSGSFQKQVALYSLTLRGRGSGDWFVLIEEPTGNARSGLIELPAVGGDAPGHPKIYLQGTEVLTWVAASGQDPSPPQSVRVPEVPTPGGFHSTMDPSVLLAAEAGSASAALALEVAESRTLAAFRMLLNAAEAHPDLGPLLMSVVQKPSLLKIIQHGGLPLEVLAPEGEVIPATVVWPGVGELRAAAIPGLILASGTRALEVEWIAVEPQPPLAFVSGIVRLVASHPGDVETSVEMRLIGARSFHIGSDQAK